MDHLTFVPGGSEFFLWSDEDPSAARSALAARLVRVGWPSAARLVGGAFGGRHVSGTLIEMIDALPPLAAHSLDASGESPSLSCYALWARRGLTLVAEGRLAPRLLPHRGERDSRPIAWDARWQALPGPLSESDPLLSLAMAAGPPEVAVVLGRLVSVRQLQVHETRRLLLRALDGCADVLVREACWRGAVVRLAGWPAGAWEQRLVHALCDQHSYFATGFAADAGEHDAPAVLGDELLEWTHMLAEGAALLPSPPSWRAPESMQAVLARITAPAGDLARHLLLDEPAPRSLPAAATARGVHL